MTLVFPAPEWPSLPIAGSADSFPVRRIFCVGRNYAEHAREMGVEVDREAPFYFLKSALAAIRSGATIPYPPETANYHHEMELVVAIGKAGFRITPDAVASTIHGYACGLDMTRRDLQQDARGKGRPWDLGKDFEQSAVVGLITPAAGMAALGGQRLTLHVNGALRQEAKLSDLVWSVPELICHLSRFYHLAPGDLIFTGTPAGVGPVVAGDRIHGTIDGLEPVELTIGAAQ